MVIRQILPEAASGSIRKVLIFVDVLVRKAVSAKQRRCSADKFVPVHL